MSLDGARRIEFIEVACGGRTPKVVESRWPQSSRVVAVTDKVESLSTTLRCPPCDLKSWGELASDARGQVICFTDGVACNILFYMFLQYIKRIC